MAPSKKATPNLLCFGPAVGLPRGFDPVAAFHAKVGNKSARSRELSSDLDKIIAMVESRHKYYFGYIHSLMDIHVENGGKVPRLPPLPGSMAASNNRMLAQLKRARDAEEDDDDDDEDEEDSDNHSPRTPSVVSSGDGSVHASPNSAKKRRLGDGNVTLSPAQSINKRSLSEPESPAKRRRGSAECFVDSVGSDEKRRSSKPASATRRQASPPSKLRPTSSAYQRRSPTLIPLSKGVGYGLAQSNTSSSLLKRIPTPEAMSGDSIVSAPGSDSASQSSSEKSDSFGAFVQESVDSDSSASSEIESDHGDPLQIEVSDVTKASSEYDADDENNSEEPSPAKLGNKSPSASVDDVRAEEVTVASEDRVTAGQTSADAPQLLDDTDSERRVEALGSLIRANLAPSAQAVGHACRESGPVVKADPDIKFEPLSDDEGAIFAIPQYQGPDAPDTGVSVKIEPTDQDRLSDTSVAASSPNADSPVDDDKPIVATTSSSQQSETESTQDNNVVNDSAVNDSAVNDSAVNDSAGNGGSRSEGNNGDSLMGGNQGATAPSNDTPTQMSQVWPRSNFTIFEDALQSPPPSPSAPILTGIGNTSDQENVPPSQILSSAGEGSPQNASEFIENRHRQQEVDPALLQTFRGDAPGTSDAVGDTDVLSDASSPRPQVSREILSDGLSLPKESLEDGPASEYPEDRTLLPANVLSELLFAEEMAYFAQVPDEKEDEDEDSDDADSDGAVSKSNEPERKALTDKNLAEGVAYEGYYFFHPFERGGREDENKVTTWVNALMEYEQETGRFIREPPISDRDNDLLPPDTVKNAAFTTLQDGALSADFLDESDVPAAVVIWEGFRERGFRAYNTVDETVTISMQQGSIALLMLDPHVVEDLEDAYSARYGKAEFDCGTYGAFNIWYSAADNDHLSESQREWFAKVINGDTDSSDDDDEETDGEEQEQEEDEKETDDED